MARQTPAAARLKQIRRMAIRQHFATRDRSAAARGAMRELARWMLDPNRPLVPRSFPNRLWDIDHLADALDGRATWAWPLIRIGGTVFRVGREPGGVWVRLDAA